jgi:hypothetical protein
MMSVECRSHKAGCANSPRTAPRAVPRSATTTLAKPKSKSRSTSAHTMQVKWSLGRRIRTQIEIPKRHIHSLKLRIKGGYFQGWVSVGVLRVCLCSSTEPSRTWTSGERASLTFRSSLHLQVRPAPAFTGVVAFLLRGGHSIRAQARSRSSVHRSIASRTPKGPATQCLGLWSGPEEPALLK